ncbi:proton-conducting transporter membrane subunit [Micromonospora sp. WMMD1102]|uniref:NADH-quinone oxidoreductase subunit N n=1 Tax=Micromonospora sp. WMMD1102 TaxID=3016105 RepID=UPI002414D4CB|nr:proton-conducting transporter membrane subunit [Micromonospora sp. WMMD1102]MDG4790033.1 proton-conducting transporter membrane subunit [Micromonospora sp. WMMD1102]
MIQTVDSVALLPAYLAAGTAVLVLLADLLLARRGATVAVFAAGAAATALGAVLVGVAGPRRTFCAGTDCSYLANGRAALVGCLFALLTLGVLALSVPLLRSGQVPPGEYCFLLACSMTGGVVLGAAGDLITLVVALETLTLPLYVLVGLRQRSVAGAEAALTFFVVSVVATAVTLLGAALLYAVTGAVHLSRLDAVFTAEANRPVALGGGDFPTGPALLSLPLTVVAVALVVLGLAFKVAAVPFHAWAPATYDGAPVPVAAYLSTASKLGGVVALLAVTAAALPARLTGPVLAAVAVLTMTVGNLVALRQRRMVRLLAWSSVAQAGYILAPLGALALASGRSAEAVDTAVAAAVAYTVFFVLLELAAFGAVVALRPAVADGGEIADYRGAARRRPWVGAAFVFALVGLAGLPPGLAGLFAKITVVRSLLAGEAGWLAVVVALNAVVGLAYYVRVAATLYAPEPAADRAGEAAAAPVVPAAADPAAPVPPDDGSPVPAAEPARPAWAVVAALALATAVAVVVGFAPQLILDVAAL